MRAIAIAVAAAAGLLGASAALASEPGGPVETITYETGPCFGACPVYRLTVLSTGTGTFEGRRNTAVTGLRSFRVSPEQYRAFERQLAPARPASGSARYAGDSCESQATDLPSVEVGWHSRLGHQQLSFSYGCDMERNRALAERLRSAPGLLPIAELVGSR
jgi:hypothetical protein